MILVASMSQTGCTICACPAHADLFFLHVAKPISVVVPLVSAITIIAELFCLQPVSEHSVVSIRSWHIRHFNRSMWNHMELTNRALPKFQGLTSHVNQSLKILVKWTKRFYDFLPKKITFCAYILVPG